MTSPRVLPLVIRHTNSWNLFHRVSLLSAMRDFKQNPTESGVYVSDLTILSQVNPKLSGPILTNIYSTALERVRLYPRSAAALVEASVSCRLSKEYLCRMSDCLVEVIPKLRAKDLCSLLDSKHLGNYWWRAGITDEHQQNLHRQLVHRVFQVTGHECPAIDLIKVFKQLAVSRAIELSLGEREIILDSLERVISHLPSISVKTGVDILVIFGGLGPRRLFINENYDRIVAETMKCSKRLNLDELYVLLGGFKKSSTWLLPQECLIQSLKKLNSGVLKLPIITAISNLGLDELSKSIDTSNIDLGMTGTSHLIDHLESVSSSDPLYGPTQDQILQRVYGGLLNESDLRRLCDIPDLDQDLVSAVQDELHLRMATAVY